MTSFKNNILKITFLLLGVVGGPAEGAVWVESNHWNQQWEDRYSQWIENGFRQDVFVNGKYQNIFTDCADAVYIARAIFAFENRLPFVIMDPTGGSTKISNRMKRFDDVESELGRFHDFANFIADVGDTKSLPNDTYPVIISREFVRPGTIWQRPLVTKANALSILSGASVEEAPGHAEIVKTVRADGTVELWGSKLPGAVRDLIWTPFLVFMPVEKTTGFRKWMEPDWYGKDKTKLPGYSVEQFSMGNSPPKGRNFSTWNAEVKARLRQ